MHLPLRPHCPDGPPLQPLLPSALLFSFLPLFFPQPLSLRQPFVPQHQPPPSLHLLFFARLSSPRPFSFHPYSDLLMFHLSAHCPTLLSLICRSCHPVLPVRLLQQKTEHLQMKDPFHYP